MEDKMSDLKFQPCPHCFPDLWHEEVLLLPEVSEEQIDDMILLYNMSEDPDTLCKLWKVESIRDIARFYASRSRANPHGFLVFKNQVVGPWLNALHNQDSILFVLERAGLDTSINDRAKQFGLPEKSRRMGLSWARSRGNKSSYTCMPCAETTWPLSQDTKDRESAISIRKRLTSEETLKRLANKWNNSEDKFFFPK
jgi:hypothetical protein